MLRSSRARLSQQRRLTSGILTLLGIDTELALLEDLAAGVYTVENLLPAELRDATDVAARHRDLQLGLADASIVVLARRYRTRRLLSFDERAFRFVAPLQAGVSRSCRPTSRSQREALFGSATRPPADR